MPPASLVRTPAFRVPLALGQWAEALIAAEQGRFTLWLPVFMVIGVLVYFGLGTEPPAWAGAALALPALAGVWLARGPSRAALLPLAALASGFWAAQCGTLRALPPETLPTRAVVVTGQVAGVEVLPDGRRVTIAHALFDHEGAKLRRRVRIRLRADDPVPLVTGDIVQMRALLRPPSPPAYPGGWDLQRDAFFAGFAGYGFAIGPATCLEHHPPTGVAGWVQRAREAIAARMQARLPGAAGAVAATLMTGVPSAIPAQDREAFRASGLAHLLAVPGCISVPSWGWPSP